MTSCDLVRSSVRIAAMILALAIVGCAGSCRHSSSYVLPDGYVGWVKIYYRVPDAAPLPMVRSHYLFEVPESGVLVTSSPCEYGWAASDEYAYLRGSDHIPLPRTGWGGGGMIWADYNAHGGPGQPSDEWSGFFVGTEAQYRELHANPDKPGRLDLSSKNLSTHGKTSNYTCL